MQRKQTLRTHTDARTPSLLFTMVLLALDHLSCTRANGHYINKHVDMHLYLQLYMCPSIQGLPSIAGNM